MSPTLRHTSTPDTQQILATIWQRSLPIVRDRVTLLHAAARSATEGHLSASARKEAADVAHKLAGSLGMFGYMRGTEIAQQLEALLEADGPVPAPRFEELAVQLGETLQI